MRVLVTGAAGFIGYHTAAALAHLGHAVVGIDNLNEYYDPLLKTARLERLSKFETFRFIKMDIADSEAIQLLFSRERFTHVVNLAAQAGVRYSLTNPESYVHSNLQGFASILEACRRYPVEHLVFASSSSVYGLNTSMPYSTDQHVAHPVSLYAATKISNERMAHSYSHLFNIHCTGLRFFTVYGPWGRPDMALFIFTKAILANEEIPVFNEGKMQRDFTYIDDIVQGVISTTLCPATPSPLWDSAAPDPAVSSAPFRLYNIGHNSPVPLLNFIETLEQCLGTKAQLKLLPMQAGDVKATFADISPLQHAVGFTPRTPLKQGIQLFVEWFKSYYTT